MKPLPNVRKLFIPDKGHIIIDCDLSGADAQVVAWEAGDEDLKAAFRAGLDVHGKNGKDMFGDAYVPDKVLRKYSMRDEVKRGVHATNYVVGDRNLASTLGWSMHFVREFKSGWLRKHPGISEWHRRTDRDLQTTRTVRNKFGYRIVYFDRPDNLLPKGLAWLPQSTVAAVCGRASVRLSTEVSWATILLQVHDSLVFQIPFHRADAAGFEVLRRSLEITIPYPDPLVIPWGLALSEKSWGDVEKKKWEDVC